MIFLYNQISKVTEELILGQLLGKITKIKNHKMAHSLPFSPTNYRNKFLETLFSVHIWPLFMSL